MGKNPFATGLALGALIALLLCVALYFATKPEPSTPIPPVKPEDLRPDTLIVHVPVDRPVPYKVYVTEYLPVIAPDSSATLDTTIQVVATDSLSVKARLSVTYDLRRNAFRNLMLGFPEFRYTQEKVYVDRPFPVYVPQYPSKWRYVEAGVVGAGAGFILYAVFQGLK